MKSCRSYHTLSKVMKKGTDCVKLSKCDKTSPEVVENCRILSNVMNMSNLSKVTEVNKFYQVI